MILKDDLTKEEELIFIKILRRYIPEDILLALFHYFKDDAYLIISLLEGQDIKLPSIKSLRTVIKAIKLYLNISKYKLNDHSEEEIFSILAEKMKEDVVTLKKRYNKIKEMVIDNE